MKYTYQGAIIVMDCWDKHWDNQTNNISTNLNSKINTFLNEKRKKKYLIIHCPNECEKYYKNYKNFLIKKNINYKIKTIDFFSVLRKEIQGRLPFRYKTIKPIEKKWTKQHNLIEIKKHDIICTDGKPIMNLLKKMKIKNIEYVGYHLNKCILYTRNMSILNMKFNDYNVKVRYELCDTLYDSRYNSEKINSKEDAHREMSKSVQEILNNFNKIHKIYQKKVKERIKN